MTDSPLVQKVRYPRGRVSGPLTATYSSRPKYPKLHLVAGCETLEGVPQEALKVEEFASPLKLATADWARPCRVCSLESVLVGCGDPKRKEPRDVFVTFTSQASPRNPDASPLAYHWHQSTASGEARLRRLARRFSLEIVQTTAGPAAFGMMSGSGARAVAANLRSVVKPELVAPVGRNVIGTLWTLLGDNPPELAEMTGDADRLDAWSTAVLLAA